MEVNNGCSYLALQLSNLSNALRLQSLRQPVVQSAAGFSLPGFLVLDLQENTFLFVSRYILQLLIHKQMSHY